MDYTDLDFDSIYNNDDVEKNELYDHIEDVEEPVETVSSLMHQFVKDEDDFCDWNISDSIWTCVDNYIDDLCVKEMDNKKNIFNSDSSDEEIPFCYIVDKVIEKIDGDIIKQAMEDQINATSDDPAKTIYAKELYTNVYDPDFCDDVECDDMTADEFQIYIKNPNLDRDEECESEDQIDFNSSDYDSVFNA